MNLKIALKPQEGYNKIFDVGEYGMKLTKFGLLKLAKGGVYEGDTGETEVAFVLMGGNFAAKGDGWAFEVTDGRKSPFTGKPHCLYLPRRTKYTITSLSDVELAYNGSPATRDTAKPTLIRPEDTRHIALGKDNWTRTSEIILDEKFDSEHFYIGATAFRLPRGNSIRPFWSCENAERNGTGPRRFRRPFCTGNRSRQKYCSSTFPYRGKRIR